MNTPNHEPRPDNALLPVVTGEILQSVSTDFVQNTVAMMGETFLLMKDENPVLAAGVGRVILSIMEDLTRGHGGNNEQEVREGLMCVATVMYQCLRSQAESNAMNEQFGYTDE